MTNLSPEQTQTLLSLLWLAAEQADVVGWAPTLGEADTDENEEACRARAADLAKLVGFAHRALLA